MDKIQFMLGISHHTTRDVPLTLAGFKLHFEPDKCLTDEPSSLQSRFCRSAITGISAKGMIIRLLKCCLELLVPFEHKVRVGAASRLLCGSNPLVYFSFLFSQAFSQAPFHVGLSGGLCSFNCLGHSVICAICAIFLRVFCFG